MQAAITPNALLNRAVRWTLAIVAAAALAMAGLAVYAGHSAGGSSVNVGGGGSQIDLVP
jgi:hypothetical protein